MRFSEAIDHVLSGRRVARAAWAGRGVFLVFVPGSSFPITADRPMGQAMPEKVGQTAQYHPHIDIVSGGGSSVMPWTPTQADMFATDWWPFEPTVAAAG